LASVPHCPEIEQASKFRAMADRRGGVLIFDDAVQGSKNEQDSLA
jgi:hypothetical protein